jgi:hypothetical protein
MGCEGNAQDDTDEDGGETQKGRCQFSTATTTEARHCAPSPARQGLGWLKGTETAASSAAEYSRDKEKIGYN